MQYLQSKTKLNGRFSQFNNFAGTAVLIYTAAKLSCFPSPPILPLVSTAG